jgi:hypothetical protein
MGLLTRDIRKDNPSMFLKFVAFQKLFGQKHEFSMFVSLKKIIIQYFNERREDC